MWMASEPIKPTRPGGWWVSTVVNSDGDTMPTGAIHPTAWDAIDHAEAVAAEWNKVRRPWRAFWR